MANCDNCGAPLQPNAVRCLKCGSVIDPPATQQSAQTPATPTWNPPVGPYQPPAAGVEQLKSKMTAGILGILLGALGIHNFYLGYNGKGIVQLLLTCTAIGAWISWPWGLIEGIMILTGKINKDAQGRPLKD